MARGSEEKVSGGWRRRMGRVVLLLMGLVLVAVFVAPKLVVREVVQLALATSGLEPQAFDVTAAGWRKTTIQNIAIGPGPDLAVDRIDVTYRLLDLLRGQVEDIRLLRPVLQAKLAAIEGPGDGPVSFGVFDPFVYGNGDGTADAVIELGGLTLENGVINLMMPDGIVLDVNVGAVVVPNGKSELAFDVSPGPNEMALSASGRLSTQAQVLKQAQLDVQIGSLNVFGWDLRGADLTAAFDAENSQSAGDAVFEIQSFSVPDQWLVRFEKYLAPLEGADVWKSGFTDLGLAGRLSIVPKGETLHADLLQAVRLTSSDGSVDVTLAGGRSADADLVFDPAGGVLDADLRLRQAGTRLPVMDLEIEATLSPDTTGQSVIGLGVRRLAGDFDSLRFGQLRIGGRALEVSGKGSLGEFTGSAKGGLLLNGQLGQSFGFDNSVAQLDGSFQLSSPGLVKYTHDLGACAAFESRNFRLIRLYLPNSNLKVCPAMDAPIMDLALGAGAASAMALNATITGSDVSITDQDRFNLKGVLPKFDLSANLDIDQGKWSMTYELDGGSMVFGDRVSLLDTLDLSGIAEGSAGGIQNVEADMTRMRVSSAGDVELFAPFLIDGSMQTENRIGKFSGDLFDIKQRQMGGYVGEHDWRTQFGFLTFDTGALKLQPGGFQPQVLFPVFASVMADAKGSMRATGLIDWRDGSVKSSGDVELLDIDFASLVGPISGVNSRIKLGSLLPLATLTPQRIDIQEIDIGIDLFFGEFLFSLMASGDVVLEQAVWPWAGGEIGFDRAALIFDQTPQELMLFVRSVDLAEVFGLLDVDGLTGTGFLEGQLPVRVEDGGITILDGLLQSVGGGSLSYRGPVSLSSEDEEGSKLMFDALENFAYDDLQVSISGRTTDDLKVGILLEGRNPEVLNGYPFKINISTEGPLAEMVRKGTIGYRVPEQIRKQLQ